MVFNDNNVYIDYDHNYCFCIKSKAFISWSDSKPNYGTDYYEHRLNSEEIRNDRHFFFEKLTPVTPVALAEDDLRMWDDKEHSTRLFERLFISLSFCSTEHTHKSKTKINNRKVSMKMCWMG